MAARLDGWARLEVLMLWASVGPVALQVASRDRLTPNAPPVLLSEG